VRMQRLSPGDVPSGAGGSAVSIGMYDGVHRGHQWLLRQLRRQATAEELRSVVVTFEPHPLQVLRPVAAPRLLSDLDLRLRLLDRAGVDACLVVPFDLVRQEQSAAAFVEEVLVGQLRTSRVLVGADFRFGRDRTGDVALLQEQGLRHGFRARGLPLLPVRSSAAHVPCSSTYIRGLIAQGDVELAGRLLDRPHEVDGVVVGTSRPAPGRGTPTVVVRVQAYRALPTEGSYAGALVTSSSGRRLTAGVSVRQGITAHDRALLDVHVVGEVASLIDQGVRVTLARRVWTTDRKELYLQLARQAEEAARASAAGGWGSAS